jgi:ABC-type glycerol-3-phosphate transport system permease component
VYLLRILAWSPQKNFISAISLVICIPVIIFTFLVQRYMKEGLTAGAVK